MKKKLILSIAFFFAVNLCLASEEDISELRANAESGNVQEVVNLIRSGVDINAKSSPWGYTALHAACKNGHTELVRILIESGADVDAITHAKRTPLHIAARNGHAAIVELLFNKGANMLYDNNNLSPLYDAEFYARRTGDHTILGLIHYKLMMSR